MPSSRPISWCTWLIPNVFLGYRGHWLPASVFSMMMMMRLGHSCCCATMSSAYHWTTALPRRTTLDRPARVSEDIHSTLLRSMRGAYTHCNEYLGPRNCVFISEVTGGFKHVPYKLEGTFPTASPNRIIGGYVPVPPVSAPMLTA